MLIINCPRPRPRLLRGRPPPRPPRHAAFSQGGSGHAGQGGSSAAGGGRSRASGGGGVKGRGVGGCMSSSSSSSSSDPPLVKNPLRSSAAIYMYVTETESMIKFFLPYSFFKQVYT